MQESVTYVTYVKEASIIGGNLDDPRLGLLFRWGMPQNTERIRATYPGTVYDPRFRDYTVEYFGIGLDPEEASPAELFTGKIGGGCIQFSRTDKGLFGAGPGRVLCAWLCRVRCEKTVVTFEQLWDPVFGWQSMLGNFNQIAPRDRRLEIQNIELGLTMPIQLQRGTIIPLRHLLSKGGRAEGSGWVDQDNKEEALQFLIKKGSYIYATTGRVSKQDVARACGGFYGISDGDAGCKAIDRLIKKCNPRWTWRNDVLPLLKKSNHS